MLLFFQSFKITPFLRINQHIVILQPSTICIWSIYESLLWIVLCTLSLARSRYVSSCLVLSVCHDVPPKYQRIHTAISDIIHEKIKPLQQLPVTADRLEHHWIGQQSSEGVWELQFGPGLCRDKIYFSNKNQTKKQYLYVSGLLVKKLIFQYPYLFMFPKICLSICIFSFTCSTSVGGFCVIFFAWTRSTAKYSQFHMSKLFAIFSLDWAAYI